MKIVLFVLSACLMVTTSIANETPWITQDQLFANETAGGHKITGLLVLKSGTVLSACQWLKQGTADFGNPTEIIIR